MSTPPPDHADVIRNALRLAADNAYPDDLARPYQEALRALIEGQIILVPDLPPREDAPAVVAAATLPDNWEQHARELREGAVAEGLHPALVSAHREANVLAKCAAQLRRALDASEHADKPVLESRIIYTGYGGGPLTVTDEAAEALKAGGFVIVSRDDLKAILEGKASPDQWMQLAAVIGVSR